MIKQFIKTATATLSTAKNYFIFTEATSTAALEATRFVQEGDSPQTELEIFNFSSEDSVKAWSATSDKVLGGSSTSNFEFDSNQKIGIFYGEVNTTDLAEGMKYTGFGAIKSPMREYINQELNLQYYDFLKFRLKTSATLISNIKSNSPYELDLYQTPLIPKTPNEWEDIIVPLSSYVLTHGGFVEEKQVSMDKYRIKQLQLLCCVEGPFKEIQSIQAFLGTFGSTKNVRYSL